MEKRGVIATEQDSHVAKPAICEKKRPKELSDPKERQQRKAYMNVIPGGGQAASQAGSRTWQHSGSGFRAMKDTGVQGLWNCPPWLRKDAEVRHVEDQKGHYMKL
jgi:hypothetical protein